MSNGTQTHDASKVILKEVFIDNNIKEVVEWINSLDCFTCGCCQGDNKSKCQCSSRPYVNFVCWNEESLKHIISVIKSF